MKFAFALIVATLTYVGTSYAEPVSIRWTGSDDKNAEFLHVIDRLNAQSGFNLSASDFLLVEDRALANNQFKMFIQMAGDVPLKRNSVRIWTDLRTNELIQLEAQIEGEKKIKSLQTKIMAWPSFTEIIPIARTQKLNQIARQLVSAHQDDPFVHQISGEVVWENDILVYRVVVKAKHGVHTIVFNHDLMEFISYHYKPFADADPAQAEFSLPAYVFPIYEESPSSLKQNRVVSQLKYLHKNVKLAGTDPYSSLQGQHYLGSKQDPILGLTQQGQADGYWAMSDVKAKVATINDQLPQAENSFTNAAFGGVILQGRYATINIHPDAIKNFVGLQFSPLRSSVFKPTWAPVGQDDNGEWEMIPGGAYLGRPLTSFEDAYQRPARRLADHDPVQYLNDGFDEVQVYFAINTFLESLHKTGFNDPELSVRPFHAFLYDPDIGSRDNAYYTDDTINFTTYSPEAQNYARDNSTIWHELGHGIMDRLMGDSVRLADTGGLSEGMADFLAAIVIEKVTNGRPFDGSKDFRIVNTIGFSLTNEVHDDGESYGGSMRDLLELAKQKFGLSGVDKVGDLTLETMRLCRNHPGVTANIWFEHMLFADELGHSPVREKGELKDLILAALAQRNFGLQNQKQAEFKVTYAGKELNDSGPGSRGSPIPVADIMNYDLQVALTDGELYKFAYPVRVRVQLTQGPLQGAIHWQGEEGQYLEYTLEKPEDVLNIHLAIGDKCDWVNRNDGSCVDFAYVQIWPAGAKSPVAKKRFYLRLTPKK